MEVCKLRQYEGMSYFLVNEELFQINRGGLSVGTKEKRFLSIFKELSVADFPKASHDNLL